LADQAANESEENGIAQGAKQRNRRLLVDQAANDSEENGIAQGAKQMARRLADEAAKDVSYIGVGATANEGPENIPDVPRGLFMTALQ
jgi:hypothetical protein